MRYLSILLFLPSLVFGGDWTTADSIRQGLYTGFTLVDCEQTKTFLKNPHMYENNHILGKHPSQTKVNNLCALSIVGNAAVSYVLPRGWREAWQYVWIGAEASAVYHNYSAGVRIPF
jgi:hypothetical protein